MARYSNQEMIEAMRAEAEGGALSSYRYVQSDRRPGMQAIQKRFGSWPAALAAAGLKGPPRPARATDEEILESLRSASTDGRLSIAEYTASGRRPSANSVIKRFGTWSAAVKAAGLESPPMGRRRHSYSTEEALDAMRSVAVNGRLSRPFYDSSGCKPTGRTIADWFGSWSEAMKQAGLESLPAGRRPGAISRPPNAYRRADLIEALRRLAGDLGHVPTYQDMELADGVPDKHNYIAAFGSVRQALIAAGIEPGTTRDRLRARPKTTTRECLKCDDEFPSCGANNRLCERCRDANTREIDPAAYGGVII
ncbi:hypothetical protein MYX64_06500 [Nitrospinae bacterium AH_259_B05_G02_I21]|nr:hypothetical protein [Nitrospinae bacterium AH_259_B05_G02_I21]